jgi:proteasome lid subunit RPN8/RPN11/transposase-like protein
MQHEFGVKINNWPLVDMILHSLRFAQPSIGLKKEVHGFLIGRNIEKGIVVEEAVPMRHGTETSVQFTDEDYVSAAEIGESAARKGQYIVGWYHSHPGLSVFMSSMDVETHLGYQGPNPKCIAIVIDPLKISPDIRQWIGFFKLDDPKKGINAKSVDVEVELPAHLTTIAYTLSRISEKYAHGQPLIIEKSEETTYKRHESILHTAGFLQTVKKSIEETFSQVTSKLSLEISESKRASKADSLEIVRQLSAIKSNTQEIAKHLSIIQNTVSRGIEDGNERLMEKILGSEKNINVLMQQNLTMNQLLENINEEVLILLERQEKAPPETKGGNLDERK